MRLERLFGRPLDIEWAFDDRGRLFLLQARPITTLRRETALNNANIVESYPGVCSPLTFSLARASYEEVFRESARAQGMPERFIREDVAMHANLLAYVDGRIYYNLTNWYKRFERIPGAVARIEAMERALGLPASGRVRVKRGAAARMAALPRDLRTLLRRARALLTLDNKVAAFLALLDGERAAFARRDLTALDAHGLLDLADALLSRLLAPYLISIANDGFAQLFYQRLVRLAARWCGDANGALANELLCGEQGMQSVDPVRSLVAVAERVAGHPELAALFAPGRDDQDAWRAIQQDARYADVKDALGAHLSSYGDRILHELKIESPSLEDDPAFVVSMLRNYLRAERNVRDMEASENAKRRQAEARAAAALRGHPIRRALFRFVLGQTRRTLKHRENLRLARTRGMGMLRRLYRRLGACFQADGLIDDQRDIALLTREEIAAAVRGSSATEDLRALIALRRGEQRTFAARRPPPGHIVAHGVVSAFVHGRRLTGQPDDAPGERRQARATLQGIACTPGSARARAKVVVEPSDDLAVSGEILVAPMTDPGWVFLMVAASGLVVEKGSVLSHTAIIGRELGIPTVVNVADAVRCIRSGDWVEIDGGTGRVTIEANEGGEPHAA
jgi:pyruvate,water dikinase